MFLFELDGGDRLFGEPGQDLAAKQNESLDSVVKTTESRFLTLFGPDNGIMHPTISTH